MYYPLATAVLAKKIGWQEGQEDPAESDPVPAAAGRPETPAVAVQVEAPAVEQPEIEVEGKPVEPATEVLDPPADKQN